MYAERSRERTKGQENESSVRVIQPKENMIYRNSYLCNPGDAAQNSFSGKPSEEKCSQSPESVNVLTSTVPLGTTSVLLIVESNSVSGPQIPTKEMDWIGLIPQAKAASSFQFLTACPWDGDVSLVTPIQ
ncbi:hypothetical protein STEG23_020554 [Scotinomys teguina]